MHFDDKTKLFADENIDIYGNSKGIYRRTAWIKSDRDRRIVE